MFLWYKNYRHLSTSEIKEAKKSHGIKNKFHGNIDSVDYDDLDNYDDNYDADDDHEYGKIGSIKRLFEGFDRDYYKPTKTDDSFDGEKNSYIEYKSRGDRYENLSLEEYLDMIRPYLRDSINDHKPSMKLTDKEMHSK